MHPDLCDAVEGSSVRSSVALYRRLIWDRLGDSTSSRSRVHNFFVRLLPRLLAPIFEGAQMRFNPEKVLTVRWTYSYRSQE